MSLFDQLQKSTKLVGTSILSKKFDQPVKLYNTGIPALNLAFSGKLDGGTQSGVTCIAGKSRSFKTLFALIICKAYMDAHEDAMMFFYDSEKGASQQYFESIGIDPSRVLRIPIMNIEELRFDMFSKLQQTKEHIDGLKKNDAKPHFIFFVDSIGNLASIKEVNDSMNENPATDMGTRAKSLKALFRIITPYFDRCDMQLIAINHTYDEMASTGAGKQIMSGGQGPMLSSDQVFIVGKRQIKEGKDLIGSQFILIAEKSRTIREKSAIPFEVTFEEGLNKYSGLLDIALITGHVTAPKMGWYTRTSVEGDKNWRRAATSTAEFWDPLLNSDEFNQAVSDLYSLNPVNKTLQKNLDSLIGSDQYTDNVDPETGEILED